MSIQSWIHKSCFLIGFKAPDIEPLSWEVSGCRGLFLSAGPNAASVWLWTVCIVTFIIFCMAFIVEVNVSRNDFIVLNIPPLSWTGWSPSFPVWSGRGEPLWILAIFGLTIDLDTLLLRLHGVVSLSTIVTSPFPDAADVDISRKRSLINSDCWSSLSIRTPLNRSSSRLSLYSCSVPLASVEASRLALPCVYIMMKFYCSLWSWIFQTRVCITAPHEIQADPTAATMKCNVTDWLYLVVMYKYLPCIWNIAGFTCPFPLQELQICCIRLGVVMSTKMILNLL